MFTAVTKAEMFLGTGFLLCVALLYVAVAFYRATGGVRASHSGAPCEHFNGIDLIGISCIFVFFGSAVLIPFIPAETAAEATAESGEMTPKQAWFGFFFFFIIVLLPLGLIGRSGSLIEHLGLRNTSPWWKIPAFVIVTYFALLLLLNAMMLAGYDSFVKSAFGEAPAQDVVRQIATNDDPAFLFGMIATAVIAAPIVEEIFFRAYLHGVVKKHTDTLFAAVISSLIFSICHANVLSFVPLFIVGLALAFVYEMTRSIWAPIALHAIFNGLSVLGTRLASDEELEKLLNPGWLSLW